MLRYRKPLLRFSGQERRYNTDRWTIYFSHAFSCNISDEIFSAITTIDAGFIANNDKHTVAWLLTWIQTSVNFAIHTFSSFRSRRCWWAENWNKYEQLIRTEWKSLTNLSYAIQQPIKWQIFSKLSFSYCFLRVTECVW